MVVEEILTVSILIVGGLLFPYLEYVLLLLLKLLFFNVKETEQQDNNPYSHIKDSKNARRYAQENSFADAILWADVGNDL